HAGWRIAPMLRASGLPPLLRASILVMGDRELSASVNLWGAVMSQAFDKPILIVRDGEAAGQRWVLHGDDIVIGRGPECDIVLPERQVSRQHARVRSEGDHYYIEDLESKNGTLINGRPLKGEIELRDGDEIELALAVKLAFFG